MAQTTESTPPNEPALLKGYWIDASPERYKEWRDHYLETHSMPVFHTIEPPKEPPKKTVKARVVAAVKSKPAKITLKVLDKSLQLAGAAAQLITATKR